MIEKIKLLLAALLVVAGVVGFYLLEDQATVLRVLSVMAGLIAGLVMLSTSQSGQSAINFARDSVKETRLVVWPTRKETVQTTAIVFALVVVVAIFLWIVDVGFLWMIKSLMGRGA